MSYYTGRYVQSHGASWNGVPLKVGELTIGDYLRPLGVDVVLVGKTHMRADLEGMARLGVDPDSIIGVRVSECGFDPYERDDGLAGVGPDGRYDPPPRYNSYLNEKGYDGDNPWHDWANAAQGDGNSLASGWAMRHAAKPARVREEDSETPYMTRRAMEFITEAADKPWCLHLSFIKPHWPYIAPAPYNDMYGKDDIIPVVRANSERDNPHPVYREFMQIRVSQAFARDEVRETVVPVYMGLIKQIDDQLGLLFRFPGEARLDGQHHDRAHLRPRRLSRRPLDGREGSVPRAFGQGAADRLRPLPRGRARRSLRCAGREHRSAAHLSRLAGRRRGRAIASAGGTLAAAALARASNRRPGGSYAFSEYDYSISPAAVRLGVAPRDARLFMVADQRWKYVHAIGFRPMLFDLASDPQEFVDLGESPAHAEVRDRMAAALSEWGLRLSQRTTRSEAQIAGMRGKSTRRGILIGVWDESDVPAELWSGYHGDNR